MSANLIRVVAGCAILVSGCDRSMEQATDYLRSIGYKDAACSSEARGSAMCSADGKRFRCVVASADGCSSNRAVACERFYVEKLDIEKSEP